MRKDDLCSGNSSDVQSDWIRDFCLSLSYYSFNKLDNLFDYYQGLRKKEKQKIWFFPFDVMRKKNNERQFSSVKSSDQSSLLRQQEHKPYELWLLQNQMNALLLTK